MTIKGTPEEIEALEAMLLGACYVGNPEAPREPKPELRVERFEDVKVAADPDMQRFYPERGASTGRFMIEGPWGEQEEAVLVKWPDGVPDFRDKDGKEHFAPHIYVTSVGACTKDNTEYLRRCELLRAAGFQQLRSPRGLDGRYTEVWLLSWLPHAFEEGNPATPEYRHPDPYAVTFGERDEAEAKWRREELPKIKPTLRHYMSWLCREIRPGSIEVSTQRAALTFD
jgi:hypothetical protein